MNSRQQELQGQRLGGGHCLGQTEDMCRASMAREKWVHRGRRARWPGALRSRTRSLDFTLNAKRVCVLGAGEMKPMVIRSDLCFESLTDPTLQTKLKDITLNQRSQTPVIKHAWFHLRKVQNQAKPTYAIRSPEMVTLGGGAVGGAPGDGQVPTEAIVCTRALGEKSSPPCTK